MSESNGFKVIDIPKFLNGSKHQSTYRAMAEALARLEPGKALELPIKSASNLHTVMIRYGIKVKTSRIGENLYAVWRKE